MQIKLLVSAAAIALVASLGTTSADEKFATLQGFEPAAIPATELDPLGALIKIYMCGLVTETSLS